MYVIHAFMQSLIRLVECARVRACSRDSFEPEISSLRVTDTYTPSSPCGSLCPAAQARCRSDRKARAVSMTP